MKILDFFVVGSKMFWRTLRGISDYVSHQGEFKVNQETGETELHLSQNVTGKQLEKLRSEPGFQKAKEAAE